MNAGLFDPVPLTHMAGAQRAVEDAAHALPESLTDAYRAQVTDAARQALATFMAEQESNPVEPAPGPHTEPKETK